MYENEYFIRLLPAGRVADVKNVRCSNFCDISLHFDDRTGTLIAISAIDNMVKGAAGQAIQNMNRHVRRGGTGRPEACPTGVLS